MKKVYTLGEKHSFHDIVARYVYGEESDFGRCQSFEEIVHSVEKDKNASGVLAMENAIVGCFLPNYMLVKNSGLNIDREIVLPIQLALWVHPNHAETMPEQIFSHAIALRQCSGYLSTIPEVEEHAVTDTSTAVRIVADAPEKNLGAIAGLEAGKSLGLVPLKLNVQNRESAWTRFVVLSHSHDEGFTLPVNKVSWFIRAKDESGELLAILGHLKTINIRKIQSVPDYEVEGYHGFIIDFEIRPEQTVELQTIKEKIKLHCQELRELGIYNSQRHGEN